MASSHFPFSSKLEEVWLCREFTDQFGTVHLQILEIFQEIIPAPTKAMLWYFHLTPEHIVALPKADYLLTCCLIQVFNRSPPNLIG